MSEERRRGRHQVDARQKLLQLLEEWEQEQWPYCIADEDQEDEQLKLQGEVWLLQQIERWKADPSPKRSHKLKVLPGLNSLCRLAAAVTLPAHSNLTLHAPWQQSFGQGPQFAVDSLQR